MNIFCVFFVRCFLSYRIHELSELGEVIPPARMNHLIGQQQKQQEIGRVRESGKLRLSLCVNLMLKN